MTFGFHKLSIYLVMQPWQKTVNTTVHILSGPYSIEDHQFKKKQTAECYIIDIHGVRCRNAKALYVLSQGFRRITEVE